MNTILKNQQAEPSPSPPPTRRRHSPPPTPSQIWGADEDHEDDDDAAAAASAAGGAGGGAAFEQMVKKLVRLALASEYSRQPVRRTDITAKGSFSTISVASPIFFFFPEPKIPPPSFPFGPFMKRKIETNKGRGNFTVMAPGTGRHFKYVFSEAQERLRNVFGMQMVELPQKEKISISQKRGSLFFLFLSRTLPKRRLRK